MRGPVGTPDGEAGREDAVLMRSSHIRGETEPIDDDRTPMGINLGIGAVTVVAAAMCAAALPPNHLWWRLGVLVAVVVGFAAVTGDQVALGGVALLVWLVANGFFENRQGQLSWHGSTDLGLMMVLVVAAAVGLAVGQVRRQLMTPRARWARADLPGVELDVPDEGKHDG